MRLTARTWLSNPPPEVFPFFSNAANLDELTPPWLHFRILTPQPLPLAEGTRIEYRIRLHGLPLGWVSCIPIFRPPDLFVDEQIRGPYRRWVHTHRFPAHRGGTLVMDDIDFDVPGGRLAGRLVARDLRRIFTYRHDALLTIFKQPRPGPPVDIEISG